MIRVPPGLVLRSERPSSLYPDRPTWIIDLADGGGTYSVHPVGATALRVGSPYYGYVVQFSDGKPGYWNISREGREVNSEDAMAPDAALAAVYAHHKAKTTGIVASLRTAVRSIKKSLGVRGNPRPCNKAGRRHNPSLHAVFSLNDLALIQSVAAANGGDSVRVHTSAGEVWVRGDRNRVRIDAGGQKFVLPVERTRSNPRRR